MNIAKNWGVAVALAFVAGVCLAACGGTTSPEAAGTNDALSEGADFVPAPHPAVAQLVNRGGHVIASPKFVVVTFPSDVDAPKLEAFAAKLGASEYWRGIGSEYGVGPATSTAVHLAESAPAELDYVSASKPSDAPERQPGTVNEWLASRLDRADPALGVPDASTIYVVYFPATTSVTFSNGGGSKLCQGVGGFHDAVRIADGRHIPFAVVGHCPAGLSGTPLDAATQLTSHELFEAVTNPEPFLAPGFLIDNDLEASQHVGGEIADLCQDEYAPTVPSDIGFSVEPMWSNEAARANGNPCIPGASDKPYFDSLAKLPETKTLTIFSGSPQDVPVVTVPVGGSVTLEISLYSNRPTVEWNVEAIPDFFAKDEIALTLDRDHGKNGDVLHLTVKRLKEIGPSHDRSDFRIVSKLGDEQVVHLYTALP